LKGRFAIVGYGETEVSRGRIDKGEARLSLKEYVASAMKLALEDAGIEKKDLENQGFGITGSAYPHAEIYSGEVIQDLGISPKLVIRADTGGNSGATLLSQAGIAVSSGVVDIVLCVGADTPMNITYPGAVREWRYEADFQKPFGMMGPNSQFAFIMRRHMHQYGTKLEDIGKVSVSQRENASKNKNAYLKTPITIEQYLNSRLIADPVKLLDACIQVNGGLAFLVVSEDYASKLPKDKVVWVKGIAEYHNYRHGSSLSPDITYTGIAVSAREAFKIAGIEHNDVDLLQIYDDYALAVIMQIEDLGFCQKGEGGKFVAEHDITYKGDIPINTGGGQLSAGQPGMAGGMLHIVEGVRQLRGEGEQRQVSRAETCVVTALGCLEYNNTFAHTSTIVLGV
jgi:acetyl-CoA acetyltransferase